MGCCWISSCLALLGRAVCCQDISRLGFSGADDAPRIHYNVIATVVRLAMVAAKVTVMVVVWVRTMDIAISAVSL